MTLDISVPDGTPCVNPRIPPDHGGAAALPTSTRSGGSTSRRNPAAFDVIVDALERGALQRSKLTTRGDRDVWRGTCPRCGKGRVLTVTCDNGRALIQCHACHAGIAREDVDGRLAITASILDLVGLDLSVLDVGAPTRAQGRRVARSWLDDVSSHHWPARRQKSILRVAEGLASMAEQAGGPRLKASYRVLGHRAKRGWSATKASTDLMIDAGFLRHLSSSRPTVTTGEDGRPRARWVAGEWVLIRPTVDPVDPLENARHGAIPALCAGMDSARHDVSHHDAHFSPAALRYPDATPAALAWALRPGGDLDRLFGAGSVLETARAWAALGTSSVTLADLEKVTGLSRRTVDQNVTRLTRIMAPGDRRLAVQTEAGGRGRGKAARWRLDAGAVLALAEEAVGIEEAARAALIEDSTRRLCAWQQAAVDARKAEEARAGQLSFIPAPAPKIMVKPKVTPKAAPSFADMLGDFAAQVGATARTVPTVGTVPA